MTSHDVVVRARRALGERAVGHTGTLDPFATGLLVLMVGRATRLARQVEQQPKTYLATARLGFRTDSDDLTGAPTGEEQPTSGIVPAGLAGAMADLRGAQMQVPPAYSAKRVAGERSYRRARRGERVTLPPVPVTVHGLDLVGWMPPYVTFRAVVSPGTYIRALARDLGERLGVGGHLTALRREAIGQLHVDQATPLERLGPEALRPLAQVLTHLPSVPLSPEEGEAIRHGRPIERPGLGSGELVLVEDGRVVGLARSDGERLRPAVVLEGA